MSDEIIFDGIRYLSAANAAEFSGLTRDYVAKLCREGKIKARRVGKNWYAHEASLKDFLLKQEYSKSKQRESLSQERSREYRDALVQEADQRVSAHSHLSSIRERLERTAAGHSAKIFESAREMSTHVGATDAAIRAAHLPTYFVSPWMEMFHKALALTLAIAITFGVYSTVDPQYARFALENAMESVRSVQGAYGSLSHLDSETVASTLAARAASTESLLAATAISIPPRLADLARLVNRSVDNLVYAVAFPPERTASPAQVAVEVQPYATATVTPASTPSRTRTASATTVEQTVIRQPVIERIVERAVPQTITNAGGISADYLNQRLQELDNKLSSRMYSLSAANSTSIAQNYVVTAQTNRVNTLNNVSISNPTLTGGSISGTSIAATSLDVSGNTTLRGTNITGDLTLTGGLTMSATSSSAALTANYATLTNATSSTFFATTTTLYTLAVTATSTYTGLGIFASGFLSQASSTIGNGTQTGGLTIFGGATTTGNAYVGGNIGIGTTSPYASLSIIAPAGAQLLALGTSTKTTFAVNDLGNLSIGTTSPISDLLGTTHGGIRIVNDGGGGAGGTAAIALQSYRNAGNHSKLWAFAARGSAASPTAVQGGDFLLELNASGWNGASFGNTAQIGFGAESTATATSNPGYIAFATTPSGSTNYSEVARFTSAGFLGIGTTTPWGQLSLNANSNSSAPQFVVASSSAVALMVAASGNVGIGTTSPDYSLTIQSPSTAGVAFDRAGSGRIGVFNWASNDFNIQPTNNFRVGNIGSAAFNVLTSGNVGIGTTTPSANLAINGTTGQNLFQIATSTNQGLLVMNQNGYLGIGTTSPVQLLSVAGNGYFTGGVGVGVATTAPGVLQTSGNAYFGGNLYVGGNSTVIGASSANNLSINSSITSNLVPDQNVVRDIGSPSFYWRNGYYGTITANNISAASSSISGTNSTTFTINSQNASPDQQNSSLVFFRGTVVPNALLTWNAATTSRRFEFNQPVFIQNNTTNTLANTTLELWGEAGQTGSVFNIASSTGTSYFNVNAAGLATLAQGFVSQASSTVGNGTQAGGLTVSGGATTTGTVIFTNSGSANTPTIQIGEAGTGFYLTSGHNLTTSINGTLAGLMGPNSNFIFGDTNVGNIGTNSGTGNFIWGHRAGWALTTASNNVIMGLDAGFNLTSNTGTDQNPNVYIGYTAGKQSTGGGNVAIGAIAGGGNALSTTNNYAMTAIGEYALSMAAGTQKDTAVGSSALLSYQRGGQNLALGRGAASWLTEGSYNIFAGHAPGYFSVYGAHDIFIGDGAGAPAAGNPPRITASVTAGVMTVTAFTAGDTPLAVGMVVVSTTATGFATNYTITSFGTGTGGTGTYNVTPNNQNAASQTMQAGAGSTNNIVIGTNSSSAGFKDDSNIIFGNNITLPSGNNQLDIQNILFGTNNSSTGLNPSTGQVGIGTSSPYARFAIQANNGETNTTLFAIASSTATATTTLLSVLNNGNVGIGTTSPQSRLAISGNTTIGADYNTAGPTNGLAVEGSVGVGVTNPTAQVVVSSASAANTGMSIVNTNAGGTANLTFDYAGTGTGAPSQNNLGRIWSPNNTNDLYIGTGQAGGSSANIVFKSSVASSGSYDTELARFTRTGFFGLGTTSPWKMLSVAGDIIGTNITATGTLAITGASTLSGVVRADAGLGIGANPNNNDFIVSTTTANLGFGATLYNKNTTGSSASVLLGLNNSNANAAFELLGTGFATSSYLKPNGLNIRDDSYPGIDIAAFNANGAITFWTGGSNQRAVIDKSGNFGIGTTSPASLFSVAGNGYFTGNVGIGTNNATAKLQVNNTNASVFDGSNSSTWNPIAVVQNTTNAVGANALIQLLTGGGNVNNVFGAVQNSTGNADFVWADYNSAVFAERMRLTANGNLGIGTTSPQSTLAVSGGASVGADYNSAAPTNGLIVEGSAGFGLNNSNLGTVGVGIVNSTLGLKVAGAVNGNATGIFQLNGGYTNSAGLRFSQNSATDASIINSQASDGTIALQTNSTNALFINSSQQVGIGTTTPNVALVVQSNNPNGDVVINNTSTRGPGLYFQQNGLVGSQIGSEGNFVPSTSQNLALGAYAGNGISFWTNNVTSAPRMMITSGGNVGIGTSTPGTKVEVFGTGQLFGVSGAANLADTGNKGDIISVVSNGTAGGTGGALVFGNSQSEAAGSLGMAGIKASLFNGGNNTTGALTFLTRVNTTDTQLTEQMRITNTGNVGIGTTTPQDLLSLYSPASTKLSVYADNSGAHNPSLFLGNATQPTGQGTQVTYNNNVGDSYFNNLSTNSAIGAFRFQKGAFGSGTELMTIMNSGNVGIGTTTPPAQLTVSGAGQATTAFNTTGSLNSTLYVNDTGNGVNAGGALMFGAGDYRFAAIKGLLQNGINNGQGDIQFLGRPNSTDSTLTSVMYIKGNGNVGIGTTSPQATLSLRSGNSTTFAIDSDTGAYARIQFNNNSVMNWEIRRPPSSTDLRFNDGTTDRITFQNGGNVGIGTTNPLAPLHVNSAVNQSSAASLFLTDSTGNGTTAGAGGEVMFGGNWNTGTLTGFSAIQGIKENATQGNWAGALVFLTRPNGSSQTEQMRITSAGNVGIGTTSPASTFSVNGNGYINGTLGVGAVSTDVAGVISASRGFAMAGSNIAPGAEFQIGTSSSDTSFIYSRSSVAHNIFMANNPGPANYVGLAVNGTGATSRLDLGYASSPSTLLTPVLSVVDSGNVGIGNTSPTYKLDVTGNAHITSTLDAQNFVATSTTATSTFAGGLQIGGASGFTTFANGYTGIGAVNDGLFPFEINNSGSSFAQFTRSGTGVFQFGMTGGAGAASGNFHDNGDFQFIPTNAVAGQGQIFYTINSSGGQNAAMYLNNSGDMLIGTTTTSGVGHLVVNAPSGNYESTIFAVSSSTATATTNLFNVLANGNVGIGTTSPYKMLSVAGDIIATNITATGTLSITGGTTQTGLATFASGFVSQASSTVVGNFTTTGSGIFGGTLAVNGTTGTSTFANGATFATNSGFVGIGTTNPGYKLDVAGSINIGSIGSGSYLVTHGRNAFNNGNILYNDGTGQNLILAETASNVYTFGAGALGSVPSSVLSMNVSSGNIGIGTTSPYKMLSVAGDIVATNITATGTLSITGGTTQTGLATFASGFVSQASSTVVGTLTTTGNATLGDLQINTVVGGGPSSTFTFQSNTPTGVNDSFIFNSSRTGGGYGNFQIQKTGSAKVYIGLGASDPNTYYNIDGNFGIGTTTPWGRLSLTAASNASAPQFVVASSSAVSLMVAASGNVGIGTASPTEKLTVVGNLRVQDVTNSYGGLLKSTNTGGFELSALYGGADIIFTNTGSELVRFKANGNVGVGTTSPGAQFAVNTNSDVNNTYLHGSSNNNYVLTLDNGGGSGLGLQVRTGAGISNSATLISAINNTGTPFFTVTNGNSYFQNGNVGIGTTSPMSALALNSGQIAAANGSAAAPSYAFGNSLTTGLWSPAVNVLALSTNGSERVRVDSSGNVGIGTTSPGILSGMTKYLTLASSNAGDAVGFELAGNRTGAGQVNGRISAINNNAENNRIDFRTDGNVSGGAMAFYTNNTSGTITERMRIDSSGNVGIGTVTPDIFARGLGRTVGITSSGSSGIMFNAATGNNTEADFGVNGSMIGQISTDAVGGYFSLAANGSNSLAFTTNSSRRGAVDSSGNFMFGPGGVQYRSALATVQNDQAATTSLAIVNNNTTASAYAALQLGAFGNSWGIGVGSTAANSNALQFFADNSNPSPKMTITTAGNVGIGTTSPMSGLHVAGNGYNGTNVTNAGLKTGSTLFLDSNAGVTTGNGGTLALGTNGSAQVAIKAYLQQGGGTGGDQGDMLFLTRNLSTDTNLTERMRITKDGLIGIGTSTPSSKFAVSGGASIGADYNIAAPTNGLIVEGNTGIGTNAPAEMLHVVGNLRVGQNSNYTDLIFATSTALSGYNGTVVMKSNSTPGSGTGTQALYLKNNIGGGTTRMDFLVDGRIGINQTLPGTSLSVNGTIGVGADEIPIKETNFGLSSTYKVLQVGTPYASGVFRSLALNLDPSTVAGGGFSGSGNILIASSSILAPNNSNDWMGVLRATNNKVYLGGSIPSGDLSGTALVVDDGTSNVGVGTTTPASAFSVSGQSYFTGAVGIGRQSTGDVLDVVGSGNFTASVKTPYISTGSSGYGKTVFTMTSAGSQYGTIQAESLGGTGAWSLGYQGSPSTTIGTPVLTWNGSGQVGIGTTTPASTFAVAGNSYLSGFYNTSGTTGGYQIDGNLILQASSTLSSIFVGQSAGNTAFTGSSNIGIGKSALTALTSGANMIAIGNNALANATSSNQDVAIGSGAMQYFIEGTNGTSNVALGYQALQGQSGLSYGVRNVAIGERALKLTTTGARNNGVGYAALQSNTTGADNNAFGQSALGANTIGTQNEAFGSNALGAATSSNGNVAIGDSAMSNFYGTQRGDSTFEYNTAVGLGALQGAASGMTGTNNTGVGQQVISRLTTGGGNTGLGWRTGLNVSTGSYNTILGYAAGQTLTTGSYNTILGTGFNGATVDASSASQSNFLNISNLIYGNLASGGGNVGIGTTTPNANLVVNGTTGQNLFQIATSTNQNLLVMDQNGRLGVGAAPLASANSRLYVYGNNTNGLSIDTTNGSNALNFLSSGVFKWSQFPSGNDLLFYDQTNGATQVTFKAGGNVGIGTTTPQDLLSLYSPASTKLSVYADNSGAHNPSLFLGNAIQPTGQGTQVTYNNNVGDSYFNNLSTNSAIGAFRFQKGAFGSGTELMTIMNSGNVGIGTTTPLSKLAVSGGASIGADYNIAAPTNGLIVEGNVGIGLSSLVGFAYGNKGIQIQSTGGSAVRLIDTGSGGTSAEIAYQDSSGLLLGTNNGRGVYLLSGSPSLGVAIGTTTSITTYSNNLTISKVDSNLNTNSGISLQGTATTSNSIFAALDFWNGTNRQTSIQGFNNGANNTSGLAFYTSNAGSINTQAMTILGNGNVGIGTTTPQSTLTVVGSGCFGGTSGVTVQCGTTAGNIYYRVANTGNYDVAENYVTADSNVVAGTVVSLAPGIPGVASSTIGMATTSRAILGVVSSTPGIVLGGADAAIASTTMVRAVALSGRTPVKVSLEGGPIWIGDELSLSSTPGIAKKAAAGEETIGIALENYTFALPQNTVTMFIRSGHAENYGALAALADIASSSAPLTPNSLADSLWHNILTRITQWFADATNGITDFFAGKVHTKQLCVAKSDGTEVCVTGDQLAAALAAGGTTSTSGTASASASTSTPPVITVLGLNPTTINVGTAYADLGATVKSAVSPNIGIAAFVDGGATTTIGAITIDTSKAGTHTIRYSATDALGQTGTATRTVNVVLPTPVMTSTSTSTSTPTTTSTSASSTPLIVAPTTATSTATSTSATH